MLDENPPQTQGEQPGVKPATLPRTIALLVASLLAGITETVGPNRLWISAIILFLWIPLSLWRDFKPGKPDEDWYEVVGHLFLISVLVNLAPNLWPVAVVIGAMIVQAPASVAEPRSLKIYALIAAVFLFGMGITGYIHDAPLWKTTLVCMLCVYPTVLMFANAQSARYLELEAKAKSFDRFRLMAGGVAHDFNNYLTSILGNSALARAELSEDPNNPAASLANNALVNVTQGADKARDLARQLLSFSNANSKDNTRVNLGEDLESLIELLRGAIPAHSQISFTNNDSRPLSLVMGSAVLLQQLFMNLIINAAESGNKGQRDIIHVDVTIDRSQHGAQSWLNVCVSDDGLGIPVDLRDEMFEPFVSTKTEGSGLGLAAAREIVRQHGGEILIDSEEGRGTKVSVGLPGTA